MKSDWRTATLAERFVSQAPERLIGDNGYESTDWMRNLHAVAQS
jgi:hypothetical protein